MPDTSFSVVLPVYAGAPTDPLRSALQSLAEQSVHADEVVVVEDGALLEAHYDVLDGFTSSLPMRRVRQPSQRGVASALQAGLQAAQATWIARMDADDIALADRFARQMDVLASGGVDVLGSAMYEFEANPDQPTGIRRMPTTHAAIARLMLRTNAINHPTAVFRKALAIDAGGYQQPNGLEDYDLWVRLLLAGARFHNLADPLVCFRADRRMYARRRDLTLARAEATLQRRFVRYGFITRRRALVNVAARATYRMLPAPLMRRANEALFKRVD